LRNAGYLLLSRANRFVVVEKRSNRLYNCHDDSRAGIPADDLAAVSEVVDEDDWADEATARKALDEAVARWTQLLEHMR
jgi:hypothetical protein